MCYFCSNKNSVLKMAHALYLTRKGRMNSPRDYFYSKEKSKGFYEKELTTQLETRLQATDL